MSSAPSVEPGPTSAGIAPELPPAARFMLPADYVQRAPTGLDQPRSGVYWTPDRLANTARYQAHVYHWADRVATSMGLRRILDVGCGVGIKLAGLLAGRERELWGVDQDSAVEVARRIAPGPTYWATDLENPEPPSEPDRAVPSAGFDLVICADVIEHLADPDPLMEFMRRMLAPSGVLVLSTPERDRLRGRGCRHSPKPDHVREWARSEFISYVRARGFHVRASRLFPQDDTPIAEARADELRYRLGLAPTSPRACQAILCVVSGSGVARA